MDIFAKFNRKNIQDRQIDTLIGLSKGVLADGNVNQAEAEFLMSWLVQNRQSSDNPIIINLLQKVSAMLEDGVLDKEESDELLAILRKISGDSTEIGELAKTSSLPINEPLPEIVFEGTSFLFTGTCAFGSRKQCHEATESLGGAIAKGVNKNLNYLVLGTYVTDSWAHETFGRKIEKAVEYRDSGVPIVILTEEHWALSGNLT
ncbi:MULTISPECIES: BRCT domain-containing protein [unclassified Halomonas]|uniref:BRCT domain-containing protein n=1 Tax=unclassified Halomonas TaxID=2609666 RepID=UPI0007D9B98D|nr:MULTISPECIES: BRCT domain-containing protein [unclassified Halomonas]MBT2785697.1 BRCT domain-containing protein [Halomonas sp. ISL-106]MBT2798751.1 BRCT domain-containing protein [Halomonas sp. ISL-104]OAL59120.1 NAD-dependent DNA ligase [Halomonas sp. ALS9]